MCSRIISRILTALYFFHLLVFSHKKFGLRREPLMLLDFYKKKIELLVYIKVSKGYKVVIDFPHDPERICRPGLSARLHIALLDPRR
jgi:hypothetical protein